MAYSRAYKKSASPLGTSETEGDSPLAYYKDILKQIGIKEPTLKPNILERLIYGLGATEWTDEAMRAKQGKIKSAPQFLGEYLWDIPKTLVGAFSPGLTKEEVYEPKGTEYAKALGLKGKKATLAGLGMDVLEPSLLLGAITGGGETAIAKGGKSLLKLFAKGGTKVVKGVLEKEAPEVAAKFGKMIFEEEAKLIAKGTAKKLTSAMKRDILTKALKSEEGIKAGLSTFKRAGVYYAGKRLGSLGKAADVGVSAFANPVGTAVMGAKKVAAPIAKGFGEAVSKVAPTPFDVIHNIDEWKLQQGLSAGGLPAPSLGIVKKGQPFEDFGSISLLGNEKLISPGKGGARVFAGDVWSPTVGNVTEYKTTPEFWEKIKEANIGDLERYTSSGEPAHPTDVYFDLVDKLQDKYGKESGYYDNVVMEIRKKYLKEGKDISTLDGVIKEKAQKIVDQKINRLRDGIWEEYTKEPTLTVRRSPEELSKDLVGEAGDVISNPRIRKMVESTRDSEQLMIELQNDEEAYNVFKKIFGEDDAYEAIGDFADAVWKEVPATAEDITKKMLGGLGEKGASLRGTTFGMSASPDVWGFREFKSVGEIRNAIDELVPHKEAIAKADALREEFEKYITSKIGNTAEAGAAWQIADSRMITEVIKSITTGTFDKGKFKEIFDGFNSGASFDDLLKKISTEDYVKAVKKAYVNIPQSYFEAKLPRAVGLNEFLGAVVPSNTSGKLIRELKDKGLKVAVYDPMIPRARQTAIVEMQKAGTITTEEVQKIIKSGGMEGLLQRIGAGLGTAARPLKEGFEEAFSTRFPWKRADVLGLGRRFEELRSGFNEAKVMGAVERNRVDPIIKKAVKRGFDPKDVYRAFEFVGKKTRTTMPKGVMDGLTAEGKPIWKKGFEDVGALIESTLKRGEQIKQFRDDLGLKSTVAHLSRRAKKIEGVSERLIAEKKRTYETFIEGERAQGVKAFRYDTSSDGVVNAFVRDFVSDSRVIAKHDFFMDMRLRPEISKIFKEADVPEEAIMKGEYVKIKDKIGRTIPMMDGYVFSKEIGGVLQKHLDALVGGKMNVYWRGVHKINSAFKLAVTSLAIPVPFTKIRIPINPAFYGRNFFNNVATMVLYGDFKNPARVFEAKKIMGYVGELSHSTLEEANKNFGKVMIQGMSVPSLFQELLRRNLISVGELASYAEDASGMSKAMGTYFSSSKIGTWVEDLSKVSLFLDGISKGKTLDEAGDFTKKLLFDYTDLTEFERKYMKEIFPFYTWTKKNLQLQLSTLITDPRRMAIMSDLYGAARDLFTTMTPEQRSELPEWMQNSLGLAFGGSGDKVNIMLTSGTSLEALTNVFGTDLQGTLLNFINLSTPIARIPAELAFGVSAFKKMPIDEDVYASQFKDFPESVKKLIGIKEIEKVDPDTGEKYTYYRMSPYTKYWLQNLLGPELSTAKKLLAVKELGPALGIANLGFGMKTYPIDMKQREKEYETEQVEKMQKEIQKKTGLGSIYQSFYLPKEQKKYLGIEE